MNHAHRSQGLPTTYAEAAARWVRSGSRKLAHNTTIARIVMPGLEPAAYAVVLHHDPFRWPGRQGGWSPHRGTVPEAFQPEDELAPRVREGR